MRSKSYLLSVCLIALAVTGGAFAECYHYDNSRITYFGGEAYCAGSGPGCTECVEGGGSCVTNGSNCTPQIENKN